MSDQPRKPQNQLKMAQRGDLKGEVLGVRAMDTYTGREIVCNGTCGWQTAVNQLQGDGEGVGEGTQVMLNQDGGVQEAIRST